MAKYIDGWGAIARANLRGRKNRDGGVANGG